MTFSQGPASFIRGLKSALALSTRGGSRVPELGTLGSVRGALSNERPYRDREGWSGCWRADRLAPALQPCQFTAMESLGHRQSPMRPLLSPEFRLAAACAIWPPSDRRTRIIRTAATGPLDWPRFLRVARRHQVIGLVHDGLTRVQPDVPSEIVREAGAQAAILVR